MGCYLGLRTLDGDEHPEFRSDKWSGSRQFAALVLSKPTQMEEIGQSDLPWEQEHLYRPADFPAWRAALSETPGLQPIFGRMLDAMEKDPSLWMEVSW